MKKKFKLFILFTFILFSCSDVFASTNTNVRTEDNLLVNDWIEINDYRKDIILKTPAVNANEKVYDFGNLLSDSEESKIYDKIKKYIKKSKIDLAIVTITDNNKSSQVSYADDFYDYNDFGIGKNRDGVLFLIDMDNRQIHMSTTGYAMTMYNDDRIDKALDSVYKYMSVENYYQGISNFIDIIYKQDSIGVPNSLIFSFVFAVIVTAITMFILIRKNRLVRKATTAYESLDKTNKLINKLPDEFLGSNVVKYKIEHDSSSGGGSSSHTSSSGSSHGGGSHGF